MAFHEEMVRRHGSSAAAARALCIAASTFKDRLIAERRPGSSTNVASLTHSVDISVAPEERPSIDVILERMTSDFETKKHATDAKEWFEVKVRDNKPFGLMVWGDPHIDNPGCNISLLRHHMTVAKHPAVFSLNIGDQMDGWVGRLERLYADSSIDVHTARELSAWFMREVRWLLWIHGNHDMWAQNETVLNLMSQQAGVRTLPWTAKFRLAFPNGSDVRIHAAHDFPGRSMHNIVHGNMRASRFLSDADVYLSGHLHDWGSSQFEKAGFGRTPLSVRVAGYKQIDSYATVNGYQASRWGSSCLLIIDPNVEGPGRTTAHWDVQQGVDILDALCKRYAGEPKPIAEKTRNAPAARRKHAAKAGKRKRARP